jgi:hypothetical protein
MSINIITCIFRPPLWAARIHHNISNPNHNTKTPFVTFQPTKMKFSAALLFLFGNAVLALALPAGQALDVDYALPPVPEPVPEGFGVNRPSYWDMTDSSGSGHDEDKAHHEGFLGAQANVGLGTGARLGPESKLGALGNLMQS